MKSAEQEARDMLDRMGVEDAQSWSAGEVVELANMLHDRRWISVKDRLPPPDLEVLQYGKGRRYLAAPHLDTFEPTHWMLLPGPPK